MNFIPEYIKTLNITHILERVGIWMASLYSGVLTAWFFLFIVAYIQNTVNIFDKILGGGLVLIGLLFIFLPIICRRFSVLLSWGINIIFLCFLTLSMISLGYEMSSDPYYMENNEGIWGPGFHFMHVVLFGMSGLIIFMLRCSAVYYIRCIWHKLKR